MRYFPINISAILFIFMKEMKAKKCKDENINFTLNTPISSKMKIYSHIIALFTKT